MANNIRCHGCGNENPADAQFCIDCGKLLTPATIGPTTRLAGVGCPSCRTNNPPQARFCVVCGRNLISAPPPPPPAPVRQSYPRVYAPPSPIRVHRPPLRPAPYGSHINPAPLVAITAVVGIAVLLGSHAVWPGLLWVIVFMIASATRVRRSDQLLQMVIWWGGIAFLLATGMLWPGILILMALSMLLGRRRHSWWLP